MEEAAGLAYAAPDAHESRLRLLVADSDGPARSRLASSARDAAGEIVVLEAEDGAEAVQLGLQQRPAIALLDVDLPRLGGIEAAATLRELQPRIRLAVQAVDPHRHRALAHAHRLPVLSKSEVARTLAWVRVQVEWYAARKPAAEAPHKLDLSCSSCGYGVLRSTPPARCPMCQAENSWVVLPGARPSIPMLTRK
jgi:CheY-like chemotaxis protein